MPHIRILPEGLSNKIAAGEVVERPASVLKELIENAIDAQSTKVLVEIKKGGRTLIRVSDNGTGMDRDDALLSIERYATSKIHGEKDLFSIATLGFRGEALPSIASVSEMEIVTRAANSETGTQIVVEGGKVKRVSEIGAPKGTLVSVNRLFFNTPARRKYLKTEQTELGHISDTLTRTALAWPCIHFRFVHNGRELGNWSPARSLLNRVLDVLGADLQDRLFEVGLKTADIQVSGFVGSPANSRTTSRGLYVYVNGRFVRDRVLDHAIMEGYKGHLMKGKFPLVVLFVNLPNDQIDVNVHPTKSAVRFEAPGKVHDGVARAVSESLKRFDRPGWGDAATLKSTPHKHLQPYRLYPDRGKVREPEPATAPRPSVVPAEATAPLWSRKSFSTLKILGQLHNTYIVCEAHDGMVLIDQHAAHERVLFESLKAGYKEAAIAVQGLLVPETLELSHREATILKMLLKDLNKMGLGIEPFGGQTYLIKSVPALLAGRPAKPLVMEILEKAAEIDLASDLQRGLEASLTLMACHGAIRANQSLAEEQMRTLLKQLDNLENPSHCPHGRPTYVIRSLRQVEKDFKRIV
jgi:DNA mismatch repair protein MutL